MMKRNMAYSLVLSTVILVVIVSMAGLYQSSANTSQQCSVSLAFLGSGGDVRSVRYWHGILTIEIDDEGGVWGNGDFRSGSSSGDDSSYSATVVGQANGYSIDLVVTFQVLIEVSGTPTPVTGIANTIFAVGVGERQIRQCSGTWGGTYVTEIGIEPPGKWLGETQ